MAEKAWKMNFLLYILSIIVSSYSFIFEVGVEMLIFWTSMTSFSLSYYILQLRSDNFFDISEETWKSNFYKVQRKCLWVSILLFWYLALQLISISSKHNKKTQFSRIITSSCSCKVYHLVLLPIDLENSASWKIYNFF